MSSRSFFTNAGEGALAQRPPAGPVRKLITGTLDTPAGQGRPPSRETATTTTTEAATTTTEKMLPRAKVPAHEHTSTIVPDVLFSSTDALFQQLNACSSDTDSLVVGHVSVNDFRAIEAERDRRGRCLRFFFLPDLGSLVVTIPTGRHEQAQGAMYELVHGAIQEMGLRKQWKSRFATKFDGQGGAAAEGDASGGPRRRTDRHNGKVWPTLAIEAGASQSLPSLRMKAQWWFAASNYYMKVVVLVKLVSVASRMEIEQWVTRASGQQRHGATTTRASRAATARQPEMKQQVSVHWAGPSPFLQTPSDHRAPTDFHVEGAPLVLRFQDLMERPPVPAAGEHDILISEADLQDMAMLVWEEDD